MHLRTSSALDFRVRPVLKVAGLSFALWWGGVSLRSRHSSHPWTCSSLRSFRSRNEGKCRQKQKRGALIALALSQLPRTKHWWNPPCESPAFISPPRAEHQKFINPLRSHCGWSPSHAQWQHDVLIKSRGRAVGNVKRGILRYAPLPGLVYVQNHALFALSSWRCTTCSVTKNILAVRIVFRVVWLVTFRLLLLKMPL